MRSFLMNLFFRRIQIVFTNIIPYSEQLFVVQYADYSKNHYLKRFQKDYPGKQWELTDASIRNDLARLRMPNNTIQQSSQIDELKQEEDYWLAKYEFRIAGTNVSKKASGNRCIVFIDNKTEMVEILLIYNKTDLPKAQQETQYIFDTIKKQYPSICDKIMM